MLATVRPDTVDFEKLLSGELFETVEAADVPENAFGRLVTDAVDLAGEGGDVADVFDAVDAFEVGRLVVVSLLQ
jgi:hypothetical protein